MLYWLLYQKLFSHFPPFRIFRYVTFRTAFASLTALFMGLIIGPAIIRQLREFQSFVQGVERDKAAVVAGLTLPQNKGLVEGKVNKLKLIKRMGYGRAGFPLLRQRVLHAL